MKGDPRQEAKQMASYAMGVTKMALEFVGASHEAQRGPGEWPLIAPWLQKVATRLDDASTLLVKALEDYTAMLDRIDKENKGDKR